MKAVLGTERHLLYKPTRLYNAPGDISPNVFALNALNSSPPSTTDIVSTLSWRDGQKGVSSQIGVTYVKVVASKTSRSYSNNNSVGVTPSDDGAGFRRTLWCFGEAAAGPTLKNVVRHQPRPASLVGSTKPPSVIPVEILEGGYGKFVANPVKLYWGTS